MNRIKILTGSLLSIILLLLLGGAVYLIYYLNNMRILFYATIVVVIFDAAFAFYILNSRYRTSETKTCWVFVILLFPFVGVLLFLCFGITPFAVKNTKDIFDLNKKIQSHENYDYTYKVIKKEKIYAQSFFFSKSPVYKNNDIKPIPSNFLMFKEYINLVKSAKKFIHISTYICCDGVFFYVLANELIKKAKAGVKVRFLIDGYGSMFKYSKKIIRLMKKAGIEIALFNYDGISIFNSATNYRNHKKILIIDNEKGVYGGSNISDEYIGISKEKNYFTDTNFLISGEIMNSLNVAFCSDWIKFSNKSVRKRSKLDIDAKVNSILNIKSVKGNDICQLSIFNPEFKIHTIKNIYVDLINNAKKSIKIVTPYFLPPEEIINALVLANIKGVEVQIILPSKRDDHDFILLMNRNSYSKFYLSEKFKIYEYCGFIHSKLLIIDDEVLYTGSSNIDYRSLIINFEDSMIIKSKDVVRRTKVLFDEFIDCSKNVIYEKRVLSFANKVKIAMMNMYKPLL